MDFLNILFSIRTPILDTIFQFCTYFGQDLMIVVVICLFYWCLDKKMGYEIGLTFFCSGLILQSMKIFFRIPRPWVLDPSFTPVESAVADATGYSFPSGHTQAATSLYFPLALRTKRRLFRFLFIFLFLLVGFSRMYLGCHTPKDVLTSMALTLFIGSLVHWLLDRDVQTSKNNLWIALLFALLSLLAFAFAWTLYTRGTVTLDNAKDSCKMAGAGLAFSLGWYLERSYIRFSVDGTLKEKSLRFFFGILVIVLLEVIGKIFLPSSPLFYALRYFLLVIWVVCIYPCLIRRAQK